MVDYESFIDQNQILKEYFNEFPKKLLQLVNEVISFPFIILSKAKNYFF